MSGWNRTPEELEDEIVGMMAMGMTWRQISAETGKSKNTLRRIARDHMQEIEREKKDNVTVLHWLEKYWQWKDAKQKAKPEPKKRRSNFRTPYNYPALWDKDGRKR